MADDIKLADKLQNGKSIFAEASFRDILRDAFERDPRGTDDDLLEKHDRQDERLNGLKLYQQGAIKEINLPPGYIAVQEKQQVQLAGSAIEIFYNCASECDIYLWNRGIPVDNAASKAFADMRSKPPHVLTNSELSSVASILSKQAISITGSPADNDFLLLQARTEDIAGRRALVIDGTRKESNNKVYAVCFPENTSGSKVQLLSLEGTGAGFPVDRVRLKDKLNKITWNVSSD